MSYVLSLDQGTTSSRAILFNHQAEMEAVEQREFEQIFPDEGWVEHRPADIWDTQHQVACDVLKSAGVSPSKVEAIGITNQRETTIAWNRSTGEPVRNAIVWQDRRTEPLCERLRNQGKEQLFQQKTGLRLDPYFSGTKINWILSNDSTARELARQGELAVGTVDSWLIWNLTGGEHHITDITNASRTLLYNIHTCRWDEELLDILEIPESVLPEVCDSSGTIGTTDSEIFGDPIPIAGVAGDQQAALFGQQCWERGHAKNTYGTGCFLLMNTGEVPVSSENRLLTTVAWKIGEETIYALEGSVFMGGAVVQWLRDNLQIIDDASELEPLARSVDASNDVFFVPAFTGLGAPHWDADARGSIYGLTRGTNNGHLARAALEGIAHQSTDVLEAMEKDSGIEIRELRVDGGASRNDLLLQFQADLLDCTVVRPEILESTAQGAAFLAGLAVDFWENRKELEQYLTEERKFFRERAQQFVDEEREGWQNALSKTLSGGH